MSRRIPNSIVAVGAVVLLIVLIGVITVAAFLVISRTVEEQFQASETQLATSLSQQMQATLNLITSDIIVLGTQPIILATNEQSYPEGIARFQQEAEQYPEGAIRSIARFDNNGRLRYAWTYEDDEIDYRVPRSLISRTSTGREIAAELPTQFAPTADGEAATLLLIGAFDARNRNTEFIVYELDLSIILRDIFSFVELGADGQLWVIDTQNNAIYIGNEGTELNITEIRNDVTAELARSNFNAPQTEILRVSSATVAPETREFSEGNDTRQAVIARVNSLNNVFVLILSSDDAATQQALQDDLTTIFGFSASSIILVIIVGWVFARRVSAEQRERLREEQRRESARALLEVSRALNSSLDLNTVLSRILQELGSLVPHDSASILLIEDDDLYTAAERGTNEELAQISDSDKRVSQATAAREVILTGNPIIINDTSNDPRWTHTPRRRILSWAGLPLRLRDQMVGVLNIDSHEKERFSPEDIELGMAFADQASVAIQNARAHELEVKAIEQELSIARGIQESLLPSRAPDFTALDVASHSLPARQVSGDYYQYLVLPDERLMIAIGDVQGKGIPAALMMAVITTALRDEATRHNSAADILKGLNGRLLERMQQNNLNTALLMSIYDPLRQRLQIANGGMIQPYIRHAGEEAFDFVSVGGYPLGVSATISYVPQDIPFTQGSIFVMLTDGVIEAQDKQGDFFGFERLEALLNSLPEDISARAIVDRIMAEVKGHLGTLDSQDDITIIVLRGLEVSESEGRDAQPALELEIASASLESEDVTMASAAISTPIATRKNVELFLPSQLGFEKVARGAVEALAAEVGFPEERTEDIKTAVAEACMNAIEHGNEEDLTRPVTVLLSAFGTGLEVRVTDQGKKKLSPELPEPGLGDMRGWGLFFIKNLVDEFEIRNLPQGGNEVHMVIYHQKPEESPESEEAAMAALAAAALEAAAQFREEAKPAAEENLSTPATNGSAVSDAPVAEASLTTDNPATVAPATPAETPPTDTATTPPTPDTTHTESSENKA